MNNIELKVEECVVEPYYYWYIRDISTDKKLKAGFEETESEAYKKANNYIKNMVLK